MSMGTYGMLIREGKTDIDSWVQAITQDKLHIVGFDLIGLCKFFDITQGISTQMVVDCLKSDFNLEIEPLAIKAAVRRAFLLGLALEFQQGYTKEEFCLPAEVTENPNLNINLPNITNPEFMAELTEKIWKVFDEELEGMSLAFSRRPTSHHL